MKLGMQSYCLRSTRLNEEVVDHVRELRLGQVGFGGAAVLDYERNPADATPDLAGCVEKIKAEMSFWSWS